MQEAIRESELLAVKENLLSQEFAEKAAKAEKEASERDTTTRRMANTIRKYKIENVTPRQIKKRVEICRRSRLSGKLPRSGNFINFLECIIDDEILRHIQTHTNKHLEEKISQGSITPVKRKIDSLTTDGDKTRFEYNDVSTDEIWFFIICYICEYCDALMSDLLMPVKDGGLISRTRYDIIRSKIKCDPTELGTMLTNRMVNLVRIADLIAVDDVLWQYSGAGELGIFIPRKPAEFGIYADGVATTLMETGLPVYVGFIFFDEPGTKGRPDRSCTALVSRILALRGQSVNVAVVDAGYSCWDLFSSNWILSPSQPVVGAINASNLTRDIFEVLSHNVPFGRHRVIAMKWADLVPVLVSFWRVKEDSTERQHIVVSSLHCVGASDATIPMEVNPFNPRALKTLASLSTAQLQYIMTRMNLDISRLDRFAMACAITGVDATTHFVIDPVDDPVDLIEPVTPPLEARSSYSISTRNRPAPASSSSSTPVTPTSPEPPKTVNVISMNVKELEGLGKEQLKSYFGIHGIPLPSVQNLPNLAQALFYGLRGPPLTEEQDLIERVTSISIEGTGEINQFYVDNFKGVDRSDQYANSIRPCSKVSNDPVRVMTLFIILAIGVNAVSLCQESRVLPTSNRLPIKKFIENEVKLWAEERKMQKK